MRVFGLLLLCFSFTLTASTTFTTQIHDIDYGVAGDETLVFLASGHVAKLSLNKTNVLSKIQEAKSFNTFNAWYDVTLDADRNIVAIKDAAEVLPQVEENDVPNGEGKFVYIPTTVADMKTAQKYHNSGRHSPTDSQCFNRAQVWSYEWWRNNSVRSQKILIFFTRTYIRRYDFEWWFHIAPYLHVMDNNQVVERVMDVKYTSRPISFRKWTDIFMKNDAPCPVITRYSEYADHPYTGECYIIRTNMFTYQPADLQMNEAWGYTKSTFNMDEVRAAYKEAFQIDI